MQHVSTCGRKSILVNTKHNIAISINMQTYKIRILQKYIFKKNKRGLRKYEDGEDMRMDNILGWRRYEDGEDMRMEMI